MCDDLDRAQRIAGQLEQVNEQRRQTEVELNAQVEEQLLPMRIATMPSGRRRRLVGVGHVAPRIACSRKRPVIIFSIEDGRRAARVVRMAMSTSSSSQVAAPDLFESSGVMRLPSA